MAIERLSQATSVSSADQVPIGSAANSDDRRVSVSLLAETIAGLIPPGALPAGGTTAQVLTKLSGTDGDAGWLDPTGGGGGTPTTVINDLTTGGTTAALSAEMGKTLQNTKANTSDVTALLLGKANLSGATFDGPVTLAADGTAALHAVTLQQLQGLATNLGKRQRVRAGTTANVTIATALNSGDALDGVTLADGDLVLVKNQTLPADNGIYVVGATPARSSLFAVYADFPGSLIAISEGTANHDSIWLCTSNAGGVIGVTPIDFAQSGTSGALLAANNLSDVASAATARTNLGLGTAATFTTAALPVSTATQTALDLKQDKAIPWQTAISASTYTLQATDTALPFTANCVVTYPSTLPATFYCDCTTIGSAVITSQAGAGATQKLDGGLATLSGPNAIGCWRSSPSVGTFTFYGDYAAAAGSDTGSITPASLGAPTDGVTDSLSYLQAAVTACIAQNKRLLFDRIYAVSAPFVVDDTFRFGISGLGAKTGLVAMSSFSSSGAILTISDSVAAHCTDFNVDGNSAIAAGSGLTGILIQWTGTITATTATMSRNWFDGVTINGGTSSMSLDYGLKFQDTRTVTDNMAEMVFDRLRIERCRTAFISNNSRNSLNLTFNGIHLQNPIGATNGAAIETTSNIQSAVEQGGGGMTFVGGYMCFSGGIVGGAPADGGGNFILKVRGDLLTGMKFVGVNIEDKAGLVDVNDTGTSTAHMPIEFIGCFLRGGVTGSSFIKLASTSKRIRFVQMGGSINEGNSACQIEVGATCKAKFHAAVYCATSAIGTGSLTLVDCDQAPGTTEIDADLTLTMVNHRGLVTREGVQVTTANSSNSIAPPGVVLTFAQMLLLTGATAVSVGQVRVVDALTQYNGMWSWSAGLSRWLPDKGYIVMLQSGAAAVAPADTATNIVGVNVTIPANLIGLNGRVTLELIGDKSGSGSLQRDMRLSGNIMCQPPDITTGGFHDLMWFFNANSAGTQMHSTAAQANSGMYGATTLTSKSIDTTVATTLTARFTKVTGADTLTVRYAEVRVYPA